MGVSLHTVSALLHVAWRRYPLYYPKQLRVFHVHDSESIRQIIADPCAENIAVPRKGGLRRSSFVSHLTHHAPFGTEQRRPFFFEPLLGTSMNFHDNSGGHSGE